jgi:nitrogenase-stabilizing/protective protein
MYQEGKMSKDLKEFYELDTAEEYFDFFDIEYDKSLVRVKRLHILKEYSNLIKKALENLSHDDKHLMDFLKFSLVRVYGEYKNGNTPSAAEVWNMYKDGELTGCAACTPTTGGSCAC